MAKPSSFPRTLANAINVLAWTLIISAAPALLAQGNPQRVPVIVGFNSRPTPNDRAAVQGLGGRVKHTYNIINAISADLPPQAIRALENNPRVTVVEADTTVYASDEYTDSWGVNKINARTVHNAGTKGSGVRVCVIDSGIDTNHPDLYVNYDPLRSYDFVNGDSDPADDNGHGTHVAGTIAAQLNNLGVVGAAPEVSLLVYKILGANGSGSFTNAIAALDRCVAEGGVITNNSYGSSGDPGTLVKAAFDAAAAAGVLNVAASGNSSTFLTCNSVSFPARYDSVVAVGATTSSDGIASFSCRGSEVELSAPGQNINSTYPNDTYAIASGTSMASPHVAGVAALLKNCIVDQNADSKADYTDIRLKLQQTALDLGTAGRDTSFGFGRIRADEAFSKCAQVPAAVPLPTTPGNFRVTGTGRNYVATAWNDSLYETGYELERCAGSNCTNFAKVATPGADTTSFTNTGLARRATYRYRIRAVNGTGPSAYSGIVTATTR